VPKRRDLRLRHSQHLGRIRLRELALFEHLIEGIGQAQPGLTLGSVGKAQAGEHTLSVQRVTGSGHSTFRLAIVAS
jgi:hypothetical protein